MLGTLHIYPLANGWELKREGGPARLYSTQEQALKAARQAVRRQSSGKLVVHGKRGQARSYEYYGTPRIQDPPKKSPLSKQIQDAVGKMALDRVRLSPPLTHRDNTAEK